MTKKTRNFKIRFDEYLRLSAYSECYLDGMFVNCSRCHGISGFFFQSKRDFEWTEMNIFLCSKNSPQNTYPLFFRTNKGAKNDPRGRPQCRPIVITIFPQIVRPKTSKSSDNHCRPGRDCGLAEWIIDDLCLLNYYFPERIFFSK